MKAKVAVATVRGKPYFQIVTELKRRSIQFISLIPGEPVPIEIQVVVTTSQEKPFIDHGRIIVFDEETDPESLGSEVVKALLGKENYENITIGVDPGEVFGLAVVADGVVIDSENCFSIRETLNKLKNILKTVNLSQTAVTVKIGNGVPVYRELLHVLDNELPSEVSLEIVEESGTNRYQQEAKHRRGFRHLVSATRISRRAGSRYLRGTIVEENS